MILRCLSYWLKVVFVKPDFMSSIIVHWGATWGSTKCCRLCNCVSGGLA